MLCFVQERWVCDINIWWKDVLVQPGGIKGITRLSSFLFLPLTQRLSAELYLMDAESFMPPPPAATFLAFHPQDNNIIAIGMDDSTIQIYNVRVDEVK